MSKNLRFLNGSDIASELVHSCYDLYLTLRSSYNDFSTQGSSRQKQDDVSFPLLATLSPSVSPEGEGSIEMKMINLFQKMRSV